VGSRDRFPLRHHSRNFGLVLALHSCDSECVLVLFGVPTFRVRHSCNSEAGRHAIDAAIGFFVRFHWYETDPSSCEQWRSVSPPHRHAADPFFKPFGMQPKALVLCSRRSSIRSIISSSSEERVGSGLRLLLLLLLESSGLRCSPSLRVVFDIVTDSSSLSAESRSDLKPFGVQDAAAEASFFLFLLSVVAGTIDCIGRIQT